MRQINSALNQIAQIMLRPVAIKPHLAYNHLFFFLNLRRIEFGILQHIRQHIHSGPKRLRRHRDRKKSAIKSGRGVNHSAQRLDFLRNNSRTAAFSAFKNHVLEKMGYPGTEILPLGGGPGFDKSVHGHGRLVRHFRY